MQILIAAGGTAGHINPALAIAGEIKRQMPFANIHFAGCKNGMEAKLVKAAGYEFHTIEVRGIQRKFTIKNIARNFAALYYLAMSFSRANNIIKNVEPTLVIGTGGYVSGPIVQAAVRKKIKTAIHEQNAFPGITNKILAKDVDLILSASKDGAKRLGHRGKTVVVGNPIRIEFFAQNAIDNKNVLGAKPGMPVILSFGGSLGAQRLNEAVAHLAKWEIENKNFLHIHATGSIEKNDFAVLAKELNINSSEKFIIKEYIDNMPSLLSAADLVISRAGALTLAEIAAVGKACILVPSPNVAENHQYHNAMRFENAGAGVVIEEKNLTYDKLIEVVNELTNSTDTLVQMGEKAKTLSYPNSLSEIWNNLKKLINIL